MTNLRAMMDMMYMCSMCMFSCAQTVIVSSLNKGV